MYNKPTFLSICIWTIINFSYCNHAYAESGEITPKEMQSCLSVKYFEIIPIMKFDRRGAPCLTLHVENKDVLAMLDLGFRGSFSFSRELIEQIETKNFLGTTKMYGLRGQEFEMAMYQTPQIEIGRMAFVKPTFFAEEEKFLIQATIVREGHTPSLHEPARVGWETFQETNLFLDFSNSIIAFCDSVDTLKKQGHEIDTFAKTPLLRERGLVEFEALTPDGSIRCMLDTGCTWNLFHTDLAEGLTIEQIAWDPNYIVRMPHFFINGIDFGSQEFHRLPYKIPIHIEAILGMEFLLNHVLFLDFRNNQIYFSPTEKSSNYGDNLCQETQQPVH